MFEPSQPSPLRVLLVDDSPRDRLLFACLAEDLQAEYQIDLDCHSAGSGLRALEMLALQRFDLMVLDQRMPEMSGSEVMAELLRCYPTRTDRPRVLAYSSCDLPEFRRKCLDEGADSFRPKYMQTADLNAALHELGLAR